MSETRLSVAAIRLPRISNSTDLEALACEPGVDVTWIDDPIAVTAADLVVVPGTRATLDDLAWMRARGLDVALIERAAAQRPILGICGGFQMLGTTIVDGVESRPSRGAATSTPAQGKSASTVKAEAVPGLGLFDLDIEFEIHKVLRQVSGIGGQHPIRGYEIHHGQVRRSAEQPWIVDDEFGPEGAQRDAIRGTHWHGLLASDEFRREFLRWVAARSGKSAFVPAPNTEVALERARQVDRIADLVSTHLDFSALVDIIRGSDSAGGSGLPTIGHSLRWPN